MELTNIERFYEQTDEFEFYFMDEIKEKGGPHCIVFKGVTKKYYSGEGARGKRWGELPPVTIEAIESITRDQLIKTLSDYMRERIDLEIAHGIIK